MNNTDKLLFRSSGFHHIAGSWASITEKQLQEIDELQKKSLTPKGLTKLQGEKLDYLMAKRDAPPEPPETCKTHMIDLFVSFKYKRREEISGRALDKGNEREEDSLTLLCRSYGRPMFKNKERFNDDFVTGEPDVIIRLQDKAVKTIDTKTSWSAHTFFRAKNKKVDPAYYWQGQCYMRLTGATSHEVAYCLVNGTVKAIEKEKHFVTYSAKDEADYRKKCRQIEINHIFDIEHFRNENPGFIFDNDVDKWEWDIPKEERIFIIKVDRNQADIDFIASQADKCFWWMNKNLF